MRLRIDVSGPEAVVERVRSAARDLAPDARVEARQGDELRVAIDGVMLEVGDEPELPEWLIEAGIVRALRPRHILFLCVANSARSQMAEGIARSLAPPGVRVSSAGSSPTKVRPQAIQVLREIGIDIASHVAKHVSTIDAQSVEAVVTLCGEEECPLFLGKALRVHWGLPDPAAVGGSAEEQLGAFRGVRDELVRRLQVMLARQ